MTQRSPIVVSSDWSTTDSSHPRSPSPASSYIDPIIANMKQESVSPPALAWTTITPNQSPTASPMRSPLIQSPVKSPPRKPTPSPSPPQPEIREPRRNPPRKSRVRFTLPPHHQSSPTPKPNCSKCGENYSCPVVLIPPPPRGLPQNPYSRNS